MAQIDPFGAGMERLFSPNDFDSGSDEDGEEFDDEYGF
jgi:hypothetical protein